MEREDKGTQNFFYHIQSRDFFIFLNNKCGLYLGDWSYFTEIQKLQIYQDSGSV